ncbi:hypothetical protein GTV32_20930 [Gordonia sp. SID5947]|uniref:hypothetical protein n=1 Tax=Gordonia sp. SID5947 TaxID=2690315 RepID=UPI00136EBD34|nr:hypothetical protein [Gordonia sp. SID5947]MYR08617.1 hypothetical protein [Gordonia sp. SID5947]
MPDTLSTIRLRGMPDDAIRRPLELLEAVEIMELVVIPGLDAVLDAPQRFALSFESSIALSGMLRKHAQRVSILKEMVTEALSENGCGPQHLAHIPGALPVRAIQSIAAYPRWSADPDGLAVVRIAFAFVAVHALTDPTDCRTASRALHLRPRPLHDDRALLRRVLSDALPCLGANARQLLSIYVSKASVFFSDPDAGRWSVQSGGRRDTSASSLLVYNPDALREACRGVGLDLREIRISARR